MSAEIVDGLALSQIFEGLKSKNEDERNRNAVELKNYLAYIFRDLSSDQFNRYNNDINKKIFEYLHGNDSYEKLGGIAALSELIDNDGGDENATKTTRFSNYLRSLVLSNDLEVMRAATKTLGKLVIPGGGLATELVEYEAKKSLEWLQTERQDNRRHAAVLTLSALADNAPTLVYGYVNQILESIWGPLRDPKLVIRIDAAITLQKCLDIIYDRDVALRKKWFDRLIDGASYGFKMNTNESIHGSLLVLSELVRKNFKMSSERYDEIYEISMKYKDHKYHIIRQEITSIIPLLAKANTARFTDRYLHRTLSYYLSQLKKDKDKTAILISIGNIAYQVGGQMATYMDAILDNVREGLSSRSRNKKEIEPAIFYCIGKLATAVGPALTKHLQRDILDMVFSCSLSYNMQQTLQILTEKIPPLVKAVIEKLINILSACLSGYTFVVPGAPNSAKSTNAVLAREYRENMLARDGIEINEYNDVAIIIRALKMLNFFDFRSFQLNEFVRYCVITYIEHDNSEVRKNSAITSCNLFLKDKVNSKVATYSLAASNEILDKLLSIAITDPVSEIRLQVLESLGEEFDQQLAQADNVRLLFIALNDEVSSIRKVAIRIIGRLSSTNPAYIIPSLRKTLIQLLTRLEYSTESRKREESANLLSILISSCEDLAKPYVKPIIDVLVDKAKDPSSSVAASSIAALGDIAIVGGEDLIPSIPLLMPLFLETFQDQSSSFKRNAALKTLGRLASASGYVIQPLLDYPQLLGMLVGILKLETSSDIRRETVRLLGILGALDPYKHREVERNASNLQVEQNAPPVDIALLMQGLSPSNDEYYPSVAVNTLMKILKDNSLSSHHNKVIQAIMYIFQTLGLRCVSFLPQIIPGIVTVMQSCQPAMLKFYFQQLSALILIVKQHIRPLLGDVFKVIKEFFSHNGINLKVIIISLIESISIALESEFKMFLPEVLTLLLKVFDEEMSDKADKSDISINVLKAFVIFGSNIEEYVHIIVPNIVKLFEMGSVPVRKAAIETIGRLSKKVALNDMASRIIHPLLRVLATPNDELRRTAMNTISLLLLQLGSEFTVFIPVINKVIIQQKIHSTIYDQLLTKLLNGEPLPTGLNIYKDSPSTARSDLPEIDMPSKKLPVNQQVLKNAWDCTQRRTKEDWQEWIGRLSKELLKQSPSHALRACAGLASDYYPLAKELFNASFASCWPELYSQNQEDLIHSLCIALSSPNNPPEIHQILLNLAEFMERDEKHLPISISTLGQYAQRCHAYAKALHYKELEFYEEPTAPTIESLITINNYLQQSDAAVGILKHAQLHHDLQLKESWYEKLQEWDDALKAYNDRLLVEPDNMEVTMGKMRCLHALGEWDQLAKLSQEKWRTASNETRRQLAPLAAAAAWGVGDWKTIDSFISVMKVQSPDKAFFNAISYLHRSDFQRASDYIAKARDLLVTEITALVSESYNRAYGVVVRVQMLAELEEIIQYKKLPEVSSKKDVMRATWNKRLLGCQRNVDIWQRMLKVRALVISPKQDMDMWIKFANLCRKSGRLNIAEKSLNLLLEPGTGTPDNPSRAPPQVVYAQLKYMWAKGQQREALGHLIDFTTRMSHDLGLNPNDLITQPLPSEGPGIPKHVEEYTKLLARCFLKQGEWQIALNGNWRTESSEIILGAYLLATHFDNKWYKAWHNWALANFEVISLYSIQTNKSGSNSDAIIKDDDQTEEQDQINESAEVSVEVIQRHVVPAIKGFFHSVSLSSSNSLQDTLRLLTLWFKFGGFADAAQTMRVGFGMITIDSWLQVIPQLISRIHQPNKTVSSALLGLLADLGRAHPQALVFPLAVANKSESASRKEAALSIITKMRLHSANLINEAELVSNELIEVAVSWYEIWREALEEASKVHFFEHNTERMIEILDEAHLILLEGPKTLRDSSFNNIYGRELTDAHEWIVNYRRTKDLASLNQAWDIYRNVWNRILLQLNLHSTFDLASVTPKLDEARNLELAVPGTYEAGKPVVKIVKFEQVVTIILSKQRPRKIACQGSDGKEYQFVLKGHEDIRQDNLVMQLLGLVNTLLTNDAECFKRHLDICQYPAIPLSPKVGLLGWVPNSDTLHALIAEYRDPRNILIGHEQQKMTSVAPDYVKLCLLQQVEAFTYTLDNTRSQDIFKVLWLKSKSAEAWLDRRTTYTRSLAVMSMVGYILGLGDRHPSNLMLDRMTGKVVHIDFGDCFEAAMLREKFPEKVPFRLTRMLTYAMEVSGIEGSFRITCEHVMRVLRDNKESLMAILEAFAYDPLINWGFNFPAHVIAEATGIKIQQVDVADLMRRGQIDEVEAARLAKQNDIEIRNARAAMVLKRITDKLTGNDIRRFSELDIPTQVDKLIQQATAVENLCQHYSGWCSFW